MSVDKWDRAKPVMTAYEREGAGGFAAGEPWYLDMATGEFNAGPNRRARRAAKARARGHRRGAEPFLAPAKTPKAALDDRGALGTIEAVEHGVLHVRMPDGALERIEVHDPESWFVVGGIVTIGGAKART